MRRVAVFSSVRILPRPLGAGVAVRLPHATQPWWDCDEDVAKRDVPRGVIAKNAAKLHFSQGCSQLVGAKPACGR